MASANREPLDLREEDAIDVGYATSFHVLLRAIEASMPDDAILYLEGEATAPAVAAFLREHAAAEPRELVANSTRSTAVFHLPLADGNLGRLRLLAEDFIASEVASHLVVYRGDEVLLWAHQAGSGSVQLARSLPPAASERFRSALGSTFRPHQRSRWRSLRRARHE
jgi:hypothetical protein